MKLLRPFVLLVLLVAPASFAQVERGGALPQLFPRTNWWNLDISKAPVDPNSASYVSFIGTTNQMHPDFGGDNTDDETGFAIYGMQYITVPGTQPLVPFTFFYGAQSDYGAPGRPLGYPAPPEAITQPKWIEGGYPAGHPDASGDRHMLIVDRDRNLLFETWATEYDTAAGSWRGGSGAIFNLGSNARRPDTWTSADAAGLAILPGLVRYDETFSGQPIRHAFRVTVESTNGYVWPASHEAGDTAGALPMGARLRMKASKDISGYTPEVQRIFQAMKTYGLIVADNGSDLYVSGAYDVRWNNDVLNPAFHSIKASDFEVVLLGWRPGADFNTDAKLDIVWRNTSNGANSIWTLNGTSFTGILDLPTLPNTSYRIGGTADFDVDGQTDLLLRNQSTGNNAIWRLNGRTLAGVTDLPWLPTQYEFCGTADFDADDRTDVLLRNSNTGQNAIWLLNGTTFKGIVDLPALPNPDIRIAGAADFNFDGHADILLRNASTGQNAVWLMNGTSFSSISDLPALPNTAFVFGAVGDFDGDGNVDIALRNTTTGANAVWLLDGTSLTGIADLPALPNTSWSMAGPR
jgi:hypothetical protein